MNHEVHFLEFVLEHDLNVPGVAFEEFVGDKIKTAEFLDLVLVCECALVDNLDEEIDCYDLLHFLDEILSVGGARSALDSFKAFRGREPSPDALLRHSGMIDA